ncbi:hypothetical protein [Streptosporangium jomthongense]|uniref:DUF4254 domain-containing protein n=1 Tax=Streptosporangium jomthongense TaxID=1193683 RepID=A0ABV8F7D1_9ACTN
MSWTAQAEKMSDVDDLGMEAAMIGARCRSTGLDPKALAPITEATAALGQQALAGGDWLPYATDHELVGALVDLLDEIADRWQAYVRLRNAVATARARARAYLNAGATENEALLRATITDCTTALEILSHLGTRLGLASRRLHDAPAALGDTYAAAYRLVHGGRVLPRDGRWITGEPVTA